MLADNVIPLEPKYAFSSLLRIISQTDQLTWKHLPLMPRSTELNTFGTTNIIYRAISYYDSPNIGPKNESRLQSAFKLSRYGSRFTCNSVPYLLGQKRTSCMLHLAKKGNQEYAKLTSSEDSAFGMLRFGEVG